MAAFTFPGPGGTINGQPILMVAPIQWKLRAGTEPVTQMFHISTKQLPFFEKLRNSGKDVTLKIETAKGTPGKEVVAKRLTVIDIVNGNLPGTRQVELADLRWRWSYKHIFRRYNIRRDVGVASRAIWGDPLKVFPTLVERVDFLGWTLNPLTKEPWNAFDILADILTSEDTIALQTGVVSGRDLGLLKQTTIENETFDDPGGKALGRALALLPGADVFVALDGTVIVFNTLTFSNLDDMMGFDAKPEYTQAGRTFFRNQRARRPKEIHVFFTREVEIRADFIEGAKGDIEDNPTVFNLINGEERPFLMNVLQSPDPLLNIRRFVKFGGFRFNIPQGSWITLDEAIDAWGAIAISDKLKIKLTHNLIQRALAPGMGGWSGLELAGRVELTGTQINWSSRFAAVRAHYWQTFQMNPLFNERVLQYRNLLVATIDPTTGTRARALVFANHYKVWGLRSLLAQAKGKQIFLGTNVPGYPQAGRGQIVAGSLSFPTLSNVIVPSPASIQILSNSQGIFKLAFDIDPLGRHDTVMPGGMFKAQIPSITVPRTLVGLATAITHDAVGKRSIDRMAAFDPERAKTAIVLTAIPAAPNSKKQLHRIVVTPADVKKSLPADASAGLLNSNGPVMEVRVSPQLETARIAWVDTKADLIYRCFGIGGDPPTREELRVIAINDTGGAGGVVRAQVTKQPLGASLASIALAIATTIYASFADHLTGSRTTRLNGDLELRGRLAEITWSLERDGTTITHLDLPKDLPGLDIMSVLPASVRKFMAREVIRD